MVYNGTAYAYVKNLQGDVIALLDGTGNVVISYVYRLQKEEYGTEYAYAVPFEFEVP